MTVLPRALVAGFGGEAAFRARLTAFRTALAAHATTEGEPRPVEDPAVENLAHASEADWSVEPEPEPAELPEPPGPLPAPPPPAPPAEAPAVPFDAISPRAFYNRIPASARAAIRRAAWADPAGPMADFYDQLLVSSAFVSLSHPMLVAGIEAVRGAGMMTAEQAAAVLDPVVAIEEKP